MKERTKGYEDYRGTTGLLKGYRSSSAVAESVRWTGPREYSSSAAETDSPLVSAKSSVLAVEGTCAVCCVLCAVCLFVLSFVCFFLCSRCGSFDSETKLQNPEDCDCCEDDSGAILPVPRPSLRLFQGAPKGTQGILKGC
jgi:hypothetical protein